MKLNRREIGFVGVAILLAGLLAGTSTILRGQSALPKPDKDTVLVDNTGYSTGIREKYQAYLITEVTLQFGAQDLKPGAYGVGFIEGGKFVVLDLAANELFRAASQKDTEIKRPVPLQVTTSDTGKYRLYTGRDFVEFSRAK